MKTPIHPMDRRTFVKHGALAALGASALAPGIAWGADGRKQGGETVRVAVVTGGHPFDVPNFHKLFRSLRGVDAYIQHVEDFLFTPEGVRDAYDVVLFYHMQMQSPPAGPLQAVLEHLGATPQGIVVLHHALLAHPQWPVWSDIVGIRDRKFGFHHDQQIKVGVSNPAHPITRGLEPWTMTDETYTMADAGEGSEILLTTDHPKSMKTLAWTRSHKKSRVFCYEGGHDNAAWVDPNFREVVRRGIMWSAGALQDKG